MTTEYTVTVYRGERAIRRRDGHLIDLGGGLASHAAYIAGLLNDAHQAGRASQIDTIAKLAQDLLQTVDTLEALMQYVGGWDQPATHPCGAAAALLAKYGRPKQPS